MLLLFILNDAFRVPDFLCSPSASGFFGGAGEGGDSGEGRKNIRFERKFWEKSSQMLSSSSLCHTQRYIFIANPTRNSFQSGEKKGEKILEEKNIKMGKERFFTEEEVNYDNYSDW